MELKLKSNYSIVTSEKVEREQSIELDVKRFSELLWNTPEDEDDLLEQIADYIQDYHWDDMYPTQPNEEFDDNEDATFVFTNIAEITRQLQHLIQKPELEEPKMLASCCRQAPNYANYCSVCGTKLR